MPQIKADWREDASAEPTKCPVCGCDALLTGCEPDECQTERRRRRALQATLATDHKPLVTR